MRACFAYAAIILGAVCACSQPAGKPKQPAEAEGFAPELDTLRKSIPGGQVILPDDPAFAEANGFGAREWSADHTALTRWTEGDEQSLRWQGPPQPGRYALSAMFWRPHPFPEKSQTIQHRFGGQGEWKTTPAPEGGVVIEDAIEIAQPGQELALEFKIPAWTPAELIPGSDDPRKIGLMFQRIELRPEAQPAAPPAQP